MTDESMDHTREFNPDELKASPVKARPHFQEPEDENGETVQDEQENVFDEEYDDDTEDEDDGSMKQLPGYIRKLLYVAIVTLASFVISIVVWNLSCDVFAFGKEDKTVQVTVTEGESFEQLTNDLEGKGIISHKFLFEVFGWLTNADSKIGAGTYTLNTNYDYHAIVNGLRADSATRQVVNLTIPEGLTSSQVFALLDENGVCSAEELADAAATYEFSYDFLQNVEYGSANRLEGYLFPDTYQFYIGDTPERVLDKFLENFNSKFTDEFRADIEELNAELRLRMKENGFTASEIEANLLDENKLVTVASILEMESGNTSESATIASVIYNRLCSKTYPLLEIESTVRYALDNWDGELSTSDYAIDSPYNTYRRTGLPAGPIGNPGIDSIRAALYPKTTDYYFFAENPSSGMHHFSETYYDYQKYLEGLE